jgi:hypothetical protein
MEPSSIARSLSNIQRNVLIDHVLGPQLFYAQQYEQPGRNIRQTKQSLLDSKLLRPITGKETSVRPPKLELTLLGREIVCIILGEWADRLVACGVTDLPLTENQLSNAMRAAQRRTPCPNQTERLIADAEFAAVSAANIR